MFIVAHTVNILCHFQSLLLIAWFSIAHIHFCVTRFLWILCMFEHYDAIFWFKLTHQEMITTSLSSMPACCFGTVACRYWNFFSCLMTLSTCVRTLESYIESSTSHWDSCDFPFVKQSILRTAPANSNSAWRLKPNQQNQGHQKSAF